MLRHRLIPCLLLGDTGLVKTVRFADPKYVGDAINAVRIFNEKEADELILLDIFATAQRRRPNFAAARQIASECFMPLAFGGGIRTIEDMETLFSLGVEKIAINTAAADDLSLIRAGAERFGGQAIVGVIDVDMTASGHKVVVERGRRTVSSDLAGYARQLVDAGAGEIIVQSVDRDGTEEGYDLRSLRAVVEAVTVPVVSLGGAGSLAHLASAITEAGASAASAGSMFVFQGRHRAVLISMPERQLWEAVLLGEIADEGSIGPALELEASGHHQPSVALSSNVRPGQCSMTVMDDSDPEITFDDEGVSNHARHALSRLSHEVFRGAEGEARLCALVETIKESGHGQPYDCVIGVSGGADSTYVACRVVDLGLRPLAIHLDAGWNSELAVRNIEKTVGKLGIDLVTYVIDWEEVKDLQRAYFRASVVDIECVCDHAINAVLFQEASRRGIKFLIHGGNVSTESIMPRTWGYDKRDGRNLKAIHRRFGERPLVTFPTMTAIQLLKYIAFDRIKVAPILNYQEYNKLAVKRYLQARLDWRPYERKHGESRFTRFFQEYYLTRKFGYDKRKAHYSSEIINGSMTREDALNLLAQPLYKYGEDREDFDYVAKKLDFTAQEFEDIFALPRREHTDFPNNSRIFDQTFWLTQLVRYFAKGELRLGNILGVLRAGRSLDARGIP